MVKEIAIRKGQLWELPIATYFIGGRMFNDDNQKGYYMIVEKNSDQMWKIKRVWPNIVTKDSIHNRFISKELIVRSGTLLGNNVNLETVKILYGDK